MGYLLSNNISNTSNLPGGKILYKQKKNVKKRFADICIINDKEVIREGLFSLLRKTPNVSHIDLYTRQQFLETKGNTGYHIVLTEIEFESKLSLELLNEIRLRFPESKIIIYTKAQNMGLRNLAIHAGADFFLFLEDRYNLLEHLVTGIIHQIKFKNIR